jgi:hypothetical protein
MKPDINKFEKLNVWEYDNNNILIGYRELNFKDRSPISGNWQIPAKCTTIEPPEEKDGFVIVFNPSTKTWDYRKENEEVRKTGKYYTENEPLDHVQKNRLKSFKNHRFVNESEPLEYNGHIYDFDERSRERFMMAYISLDDKDLFNAIDWFDMNGNLVTLHKEDIVNIFKLGLERSTKIYQFYKEMKKKVMECKTAEEVTNLKWPRQLDL